VTGRAAKVSAPFTADAIALKGKIKDMSRKEPGYAERLQTAAKAKQAQLEKMHATVLTSDAQSTEREAARIEAAKARQIRTAERRQADLLAAKQKVAERAAEAARKALAVTEEKVRKEAERVAQAEAEAVLKINQKAARDSKYAARKARQK